MGTIDPELIQLLGALTVCVVSSWASWHIAKPDSSKFGCAVIGFVFGLFGLVGVVIYMNLKQDSKGCSFSGCNNPPSFKSENSEYMVCNAHRPYVSNAARLEKIDG